MGNPIVILDRQHHGKPRRRRPDSGAVADLDGDGHIETHEWEANLTPLYIEAARDYLETRGIQVVVLEWGSYKARHAYAAAIAGAADGAPVAYCAAHLNAGGGQYAAILHDPRSRGGRGLAVVLAKALEEEFDELSKAKAVPAGNGTRAFSTYAGIYAGPANLSGVCFEPCFMDTPEHRPLLTPGGLTRIGVALAKGCRTWIENRYTADP